MTLLSTNLPAHSHSMNATTANGDNNRAGGRLYATVTNASNPAPPLYASANGGALVPQNAQTVATAGGNQPHPNLQPYSVINFCIALSGIFPSRN